MVQSAVKDRRSTYATPLIWTTSFYRFHDTTILKSSPGREYVLFCEMLFQF